MIIVLKPNISKKQETIILREIRKRGYRPHVMRGVSRIVIGAIGDELTHQSLETLANVFPQIVESVMPVQKRYKLVSREAHPQDSTVTVRENIIGGKKFHVMAGPCSVESETQLMTTARAVKKAGATMLRGGAYKPRTSPYDFQGLGIEALKILSEAREETGLPVVTEVMSTEDVDVICEHVDMLQVGARNMQNFALLRRLATVDRPILLKRGPSSTVKEWLLAAEYLLSGGNGRVVLCERGIKTFETETRNTMDLAAVALARELSHLPVIADPSHGTGKQSLIAAMSRAAVAVGADGLIVEVHPCPERALSDGPQSLDFAGFENVMRGLCAPLPKIARSQPESVGSRAEA